MWRDLGWRDHNLFTLCQVAMSQPLCFDGIETGTMEWKCLNWVGLLRKWHSVTTVTVNLLSNFSTATAGVIYQGLLQLFYHLRNNSKLLILVNRGEMIFFDEYCFGIGWSHHSIKPSSDSRQSAMGDSRSTRALESLCWESQDSEVMWDYTSKTLLTKTI